MAEAYVQLHALGYAHSVETWEGEVLVGGLYGVSLGSCFFGESMFADRSDASKIGFVRLVGQLKRWRFSVIDCQVYTRHLNRFGAREIRRREYLERLRAGLEAPTRQGKWCFEPE
jgi:leucyl/phenylalanyl-tRNA--protein transferase